VQLTINNICELINGKLENSTNPDFLISAIVGIEEASENHLSFLHNNKYTHHIYTTKAAAVLVDKTFKPEKKISSALIRVDNVYNSLIQLLEITEITKFRNGIEEPVYLADNVFIGENIYLGAFCYIGKNSRIADHVKIYPNCYIGDDVVIGENTILFAGVKVYSGSRIGENCILHSGCVIGSDGFGHAPQKDGTYKKIPQVGNVVIHNHVEIGANTTIDRATIESTIINAGVKLDNQIMIAHNVEIGENTVIAAQTGISGSTKIGKNCVIAGQVGFVGHIQIADGSRFGAKSGISQSIEEPDKDWFGVPLMPVSTTLKIHAILKKLPELYKQINTQQKEIIELKKKINQE